MQRSVLVLGASGGLGSSLCRELASLDYKVICAGRDPEKTESIAKEIDAPFIIVDAANFSSMSACFAEAVKLGGTLSGAVNAVGSLHLKPAHTSSEDEWMSVINTNLSSCFATIKFAAKAMMSSGGSIVLVSSAAAFTGMPNHEAIAAAKGGVVSLARSAASTYARHNIRVNCVAPGLMETPLTKAITSSSIQLEASVQMHPLGRIGTPQDVVPAIEWLLSDKSSWVTGEVIKIDGGLASLRTRAQAKSGS